MASVKRKFEPTGSFRCERCGFTSLVYSFSKSCPFSSGLVFSEDCFIGRDPFSEKHKPLVLGSRCAVCHRTICVSQDCSIFYTRRYCKDCFDNNRSRFPLELQKVRKNNSPICHLSLVGNAITMKYCEAEK